MEGKREQLEEMKKRDINIAKVDVFIDNESTFCNINSDETPEEQSLMFDIRRIQQMLSQKETQKVHLVDTKDQIADIMTKQIKCPDSLLQDIFGNYIWPIASVATLVLLTNLCLSQVWLSRRFMRPGMSLMPPLLQSHVMRTQIR